MSAGEQGALRKEVIGNAVLYLGDCREVLPTLPSCSIDSAVMDPPYELGFMGRAWDSTGIAYDASVWREVLRVLKPGGHLLSFGGSRTYHRMACAIEDAGFEIRDQIMWIYGSGFPKSKNLADEWEGWGTALKPAHEPIVMARKPLIGTVAANVETHGTGAINIDGCRVPVNDASYARNCSGDRGHSGTRSADRTVATNIRTGGGSAANGRHPANVIHDGSDDVVSFFPFTVSGAKAEHHIRSTSKTKNAFGARAALPENFPADAGSAARFFYCAKASKADRDEGLDGFTPQAFVQFQTANGTSGKASSLSEGRNTEHRNTHPTVKPTALMRYLCRLVTPPGGVVLDAFMGSGSTGKAALQEGFQFIGCELLDEHFEIARARVAAADRAPEPHSQGSLFGEAAA